MSSSSSADKHHRRHRSSKHQDDRHNDSSEDEYLFKQPSTSSSCRNTTTHSSSIITDQDNRVRVSKHKSIPVSSGSSSSCTPDLIARSHSGGIGSGIASVVNLFRSPAPLPIMPTRGPMGSCGPPGEMGPPGERGERGHRGLPGIAGKDGKDGVDGKDGRRGPRGFQGSRGERGECGPPGRDGKRGKTGPPGRCICTTRIVRERSGRTTACEDETRDCDDDPKQCEETERCDEPTCDDNDECCEALDNPDTQLECHCGQRDCNGECNNRRKVNKKKNKRHSKKKITWSKESCSSSCSSSSEEDMPIKCKPQHETQQFCESSCNESHQHKYRRCNNLQAHGNECNCGASSTDAWQTWNNQQHSNATTALTAATVELQQLLRQFPLLAQSLLGKSNQNSCETQCESPKHCDPKPCEQQPQQRCSSSSSDDEEEEEEEQCKPPSPPKAKCKKEQPKCSTCQHLISQCECQDYPEEPCDDDDECVAVERCDKQEHGSSDKCSIDENLDWCNITKCKPNRTENCCIIATSYYLDGGNATTTMLIAGFTSPTNAHFRKDTLLLTSTSPINTTLNAPKAVYIQILIPGIYTVSYSVNFVFTQPEDTSAPAPSSVANYTTGVIISDGNVDPAALGNIGTVNPATGISVPSIMKFTSPVTTLTLMPTYIVIHNTFTLDFTTAGVHNISYPFIGVSQSLGGNGDLVSIIAGPGPEIGFINVNMTVVRQDLDNTTPTRITYPMVQQIGSVVNSLGVTINGGINLTEPNQALFGFGHAMNACGTVIAIAYLTGIYVYQTCGASNSWRYFQSLPLPVGYSISPTAWDFIDMNSDGTTLAISALTVPTVQNVLPQVVALVYTRCNKRSLFTPVPTVLQPPNVTTTAAVQGALTIADNTGRLAFANMGLGTTAGNFSGAVFVYRNIASHHSTANFVQEQTLMPPDLINSLTGSSFGNNLEFSCNANSLSVGSAGDSTSGATFIFNRSGTTWTELTKLSDTTAVVGAQQGFSTDITDDGLVIVSGVPNANGGIGAVQIFTRLNVTDILILSQTISGSNNIGLSHQGQAVAITGDGRFIVVGAPDDGLLGRGAVYIFSNNTGSFIEKIKLPLPSGFTGTGFGRSLQWSADATELSIGSNGNGVFVYVISN
jgi:hypothetical protein